MRDLRKKAHFTRSVSNLLMMAPILLPYLLIDQKIGQRIGADPDRNVKQSASASPDQTAKLSIVPDINRNTQPNLRSSAEPGRKAVESPIKYTGVLYKSGNHRDPFINPLLYKKEAATDEELARGLPPPGIGGTYIAQATLQGIVLRDDERVAVVRGADKRAYFLRQGDKLFDGYVKSIEVDFITLIRETKMRSGKYLTQDVVKRLRTP